MLIRENNACSLTSSYVGEEFAYITKERTVTLRTIDNINSQSCEGCFGMHDNKKYCHKLPPCYGLKFVVEKVRKNTNEE